MLLVIFIIQAKALLSEYCSEIEKKNVYGNVGNINKTMRTLTLVMQQGPRRMPDHISPNRKGRSVLSPKPTVGLGGYHPLPAIFHKVSRNKSDQYNNIVKIRRCTSWTFESGKSSVVHRLSHKTITQEPNCPPSVTKLVQQYRSFYRSGNVSEGRIT